jgi:2',3'-cyclic-nucleotide 2'-phosphodiesterase
MIRILFLGDIVGEPGRNAVAQFLPGFKEREKVDFVIVNGENSAGGRGITPKIAVGLLRLGVAVITTGDHVWDQRELSSYLSTEPRILRPLNYPQGTPGQGSIVLDTTKGKVAVINIQCRTFMQPILENPFRIALREAKWLRSKTPVIFVDAHGETTSEKTALAHYLDGIVSAVAGTHTHVQTADEQILPQGTAFLCDAGMCGAEHSILGREVAPIVRRFVNNLPVVFPVAQGIVKICGALVDVDESTGRATAIRRVQERMRPTTAAST